MLNLIITLISCALILYLFAATVYLVVLAISFVVITDKIIPVCSSNNNRFAILVPAHNEEMLVSIICQSLSKVNYPSNLYDVFIIADNCNDNTIDICNTYPVNVIIRNDVNNIGKGYAIKFGFNNIPLDLYDAVLIIDADNFVDENILIELDKMLNQGEQAIQCYNIVGNREDSWFTQLLFVSRTISNLLYHQAKYQLGLSSYLMGNGICFKVDLIKRKGWTAFTIGEDWEYYAQLIAEKIKIGFAVKAKVYHQESKSLTQATSQRLRWSSGRFYVAKKMGLKLLRIGLMRREWLTIDASLPLIFPNYSLQVNLTFVSIILVLFNGNMPINNVLLTISLTILLAQVLLFAYGVYLSGQYVNVIKAVCYAPLFLIWKMIIDVVSFVGIYRGEKWIRTKRHISGEK
jgi:cellulose synthase/poly-beta-1,6-N-acetylglucosamine synthase-like glycosyltransferase